MGCSCNLPQPPSSEPESVVAQRALSLRASSHKELSLCTACRALQQVSQPALAAKARRVQLPGDAPAPSSAAPADSRTRAGHLGRAARGNPARRGAPGVACERRSRRHTRGRGHDCARQRGHRHTGCRVRRRRRRDWRRAARRAAGGGPRVGTPGRARGGRLHHGRGRRGGHNDQACCARRLLRARPAAAVCACVRARVQGVLEMLVRGDRSGLGAGAGKTREVSSVSCSLL